MKTEVWLAFAFGAFFLLISLAFALIAFYLPKPANPEMVGNFLYVMQVVLAISASGVAAVIPGFLSVNVQQKLGKAGTFGIRAGGAIAVFVIVFLVNPKSITLDQVNQRVGFDERLSKCMSYIPVAGAPLSGALEYCREARDFDPNRWESYRQLARIYYWFDDYKGSIENYKKAISILVGKDPDTITNRDQIAADFVTEFCLMEYGIAMGSVGLANLGQSSAEKIASYQASFAAAEKSGWFVHATRDPGAQLYTDLLYIEALDDAYIWLEEDDKPHRDIFDAAVTGFERFLKQPGAVPQWAEYHLSCLYVEAAHRFGSGQATAYDAQARAFLVKSLQDLLHSQTEKAAIQYKLMKCRLKSPDVCPPPRGSEAMICRSVTRLVQGDPEMETLISNL
jgi:tetratricopeptide (TPR) repeat protein